uniref:Vps16_C domain-containing protein n=1 Tax=Rhabditophanes sp. KR3021 TaxID=114890 RepID=A0AC35TIL6_9BILA
MSNPFLDSPPKSDLNLPDADSTNPFAVDDINESTSIDLKKDSFEDDFLTNFDKVSMQADKNELIKYVDAKIKAIKDEAVHKITEKTNVQYTLLILYLISLKIKEVTESRCSDAKEVALQKLELLKFFARPDVLEVCKEHWVTVSKIMKEKSCSSSRLFLAQKFNDNEVITDMLCQDGNFEKALMHVLKIKDRHLFMKFSPQFIQFIPDLFVEQFKNCPLNVRANIDDYLKILYTLAENKERVNLALRYLEWSYDNDLGCEEAFNLHIGLTAQAEPSNLLKLLQKLSMKRPVQFDLRFALFVSERADQYKCASLVYGLMGLWERAVSVCLDNDDYQEAEECAIKMASFSTNDISTSFLFEGALFGEEGESEFDFEKPSEITQKKVNMKA